MANIAEDYESSTGDDTKPVNKTIILAGARGELGQKRYLMKIMVFPSNVHFQHEKKFGEQD